MNNIWILAQADVDEQVDTVSSEDVAEQQTLTTVRAGDPNGSATTPPPKKSFPQSQLIFIGLMVVVMYMLFFRGPRKKQQKHKQMVQTLQKNDRVRTIGGIIGTVVDVKDDEVTLKIDESNNTKIKILSSAIGKNMSKEEK